MKTKTRIITFLITGIALLLMVAFATSLSVPGSGGIIGSDSMGNPIYMGRSSQAFSISLYESGGKEYECFVDDHTQAGCKVQKDTNSVPKGAQIVHHTSSAYDYVGGGNSGWEGYESCVGFMTTYGCDPNACALHNGGYCSGLDTDGQNIECGTNSDCDKRYPGQERSCVYGICEARVIDKNADPYKCIKGQIYRLVDGRWKMYGSCMDKYSVAKCKGGFAEISGDDPREVCQADCLSDKDCNSGYQCSKVTYTVEGSSKSEQGGRCIPEEAKTQEEAVYQKQTELALQIEREKTECARDGGEWTGTDCINKNKDEIITESLKQETITDYTVATCKNGTRISYTEYQDGKRCPGDEETTKPWYDPTGEKGKLVLKVIGVLVVLAVIGIIAYFVFRPKKKDKKKGARK